MSTESADNPIAASCSEGPSLAVPSLGQLSNQPATFIQTLLKAPDDVLKWWRDLTKIFNVNFLGLIFGCCASDWSNLVAI